MSGFTQFRLSRNLMNPKTASQDKYRQFAEEIHIIVALVAFITLRLTHIFIKAPAHVIQGVMGEEGHGDVHLLAVVGEGFLGDEGERNIIPLVMAVIRDEAIQSGAKSDCARQGGEEHLHHGQFPLSFGQS
jgi:hypothetical protein